MNQTAIVAGGCFWGMESRFQQLAGVLDTEVGYTGGFLEDPTYRQVCQDITGHVEAVKIEFDPSVISYRAILEAFFTFHNPTLCRENCSSQSSQYGSTIFPLDEEQKLVAKAVLDELKANMEARKQAEAMLAQQDAMMPQDMGGMPPMGQPPPMMGM